MFLSYVLCFLLSLYAALKLPIHKIFAPSLTQRYRNLFALLTELMRNPHIRQKSNTNTQSLQYKHYYSLMNLLLATAKKHGGKCVDLLALLRENMAEDYRSEIQQRQLWQVSLMQFAVISSLAWSMTYATMVITEFSPPRYAVILAFFWQLLGLSIFILWYRGAGKRYFAPVTQLYQVLYTLQVLQGAPISLAELSTRAGISELKNIKDKQLTWFVNRIYLTIEKTRQSGRGLHQDIDFLRLELQHVHRQRLAKMQRLLAGLKLVITIVFFVVSYFFLMIQMVSPVLSQAW